MSIVTAPERVTTYLADRHGDRLPFSCTLAVLKSNTDLAEIISFATRSLKVGAGVKLIIESDFRLSEPDPDFDLTLVLKGNSDTQYLDEITDQSRVNVNRVCPTLVVGDSIDSILASISEVFRYQRTGIKQVAVDLSNLRPRDTANSNGLVASGAVIFYQIFEAIRFHLNRQTMHSLLRLFGTLNAVILRGGYKKGIITSAIMATSPYLTSYLDVPLVSLPGSHKKGVILTSKPNQQLKSRLSALVDSESLFLEKQSRPNLYANVCQGILLADRGTCLIYRVNLGQVSDLAQLDEAFKACTIRAINTHVEWRKLHPQKANNWADLTTDNQVAVDVMGMANLLASQKISYDDFIKALWYDNTASDNAKRLVGCLRRSYQISTMIADRLADYHQIPKFDRLHTVEPAQSHSYRCKDINGFTICRGIWTPNSRYVNRMSHADSETITTYDMGNVETRLDPESHLKLCQGYYNLMKQHGRVHSVSYDTVKDFGLDGSGFDQWYDSSLPTLYYNMTRDYATADYARKVIKPVQLCSSCED